MIDKSEPHAEQATIFSCICEAYGQDIFAEIKFIRRLMWHSIRIHRNDILKVQITGRSLTDLECFGYLALIYTVKNMTIMDKEAWAHTTFGAEPHEHHVKAENLHIVDPFTLLATNGDLEPRAVSRRIDGKIASFLIQLTGNLFKSKNGMS